MRIPHRCVRDQKPLVTGHPLFAKFLRTHLGQKLLGSCCRLGSEIKFRNRRCGEHLVRHMPLGKGVAVHHHVREIVQQLRGPVLLGGELQEVGIAVDESGGRLPASKIRMLRDVEEERNVRLHPADSELVQAAVHPIQRLLEGPPVDRQLDEHGVVVGCDHRVGRAQGAILPDAESPGTAIGQDLPKVWREPILGVLGRDAALDGESIPRNILLLRETQWLIVQLVPLGDQDLAADDVDARDLLGHRVLHLDPGIHLDEVPAA